MTAVTAEQRARVLELVASDPRLSQRKLAAAVGISRYAVKQVLDAPADQSGHVAAPAADRPADQAPADGRPAEVVGQPEGPAAEPAEVADAAEDRPAAPGGLHPAYPALVDAAKALACVDQSGRPVGHHAVHVEVALRLLVDHLTVLPLADASDARMRTHCMRLLIGRLTAEADRLDQPVSATGRSADQAAAS